MLEATLDSLEIPGKKVQPERLIADKGYDSNKARQLIESRGMLPIIPARKNNTKAIHQDGRHMQRYRNRWIIERTTMPGCKISDDWLCVMNVRILFSKV